MRIVLCYPVEPRHLAQIAAVAPQAELVPVSYEKIADELCRADLFCGHDRFNLGPWDEAVRVGRLRWIQSSAAGMDHCLLPSVVASDIRVSSASGLLANQVAEQTFALLFGVARSLPIFFRAQQKHEFIRLPTLDVHGSTIGIVGLGGNGRRIARVLAPFGCRLLATDYFPEAKPPEVEELWSADRLDELLPLVDYLIITAPLNEHTRGLIDARRLALMKRGAVLINVARGPLVVERDLVQALRSGHVSLLGTDVAEIEPLPVDSPLWDLPNVLITPHVGGQNAHRSDDMTTLYCENLRRYLHDEPLINELDDKRLGFPHPSRRIPEGLIPFTHRKPD